MEEIRFCSRCGSATEPQVKDGRLRPVCTSCGTVFFLDPKVAAGVIAPINNKIVMIRRNMEPGIGKWSFPGGFVDRGEAVEAAAIREFKEETGLDVELTGLIGVYSRPGDPNILVVYSGRVNGGEPTPGPEAQEVGLFDVESLPSLAFERDVHIISRWRSQRGL